jgi:hypothetical protein
MTPSVPRPLLVRTPVQGAIVRRIPIVVLDLSAAGCLVESAEKLGEGTVGVLELAVDGERYSEVVRICRSTGLVGGDFRCRAGTQFLPLTAGTERSLRWLARRIEGAPRLRAAELAPAGGTAPAGGRGPAWPVRARVASGAEGPTGPP